MITITDPDATVIDTIVDAAFRDHVHRFGLTDRARIKKIARGDTPYITLAEQQALESAGVQFIQGRACAVNVQMRVTLGCRRRSQSELAADAA